MRWMVGLFLGLALASAAMAEDAEVSTYKGWGGEGGQVFRSKVSICRNTVYNERSTLVIVDDLPRRGARIGIQRFTVDYSGGDGSGRILTAIHKKPYEYVMIKMYDTPQSPRMARVVLPQPRGVKATFKFYKFRHHTPTGETDSGLVPELTRTIDTETLEQLPPISPMKDLTLRKGRADDARTTTALNELAAVEAPAPEPDAPRSDAAPQPEPARDAAPKVLTNYEPAPSLPGGYELPPPPPSAPNAPKSTFAPAAEDAVNPNDPRLEMTRRWAAQVADQIKTAPPKPARALGVSDVPSDVPRLEYEEDTPEMKAAEARAAALAEKVRVEQAFQ